MSTFLKKIFHNCKNHLEGPIHVWPLDGCTDGNHKVWKNYRCTICGKYYTTSGKDFYRIPFWDTTPLNRHFE